MLKFRISFTSAKGIYLLFLVMNAQNTLSPENFVRNNMHDSQISIHSDLRYVSVMIITWQICMMIIIYYKQMPHSYAVYSHDNSSNCHEILKWHDFQDLGCT